MNQSAILAAALIAGFGLFIASRDRLPVYARILWGDKPGTHSEAVEPGEAASESEDWFNDWTPFGMAEDVIQGDLKLPEIPNFNWDLGQ